MYPPPEQNITIKYWIIENVQGKGVKSDFPVNKP